MHFLGYTYPQHSQPQKSHNVELKFNRSLLITCIDGESPDLLNLFLMTYHSEQMSTRHYPKSWMHTGVFLLLLFFFFLAMPHGMWDLNSLPGIDSTGCAVEMQNPNHWTTREFLDVFSCSPVTHALDGPSLLDLIGISLSKVCVDTVHFKFITGFKDYQKTLSTYVSSYSLGLFLFFMWFLKVYFSNYMWEKN